MQIATIFYVGCALLFVGLILQYMMKAPVKRGKVPCRNYPDSCEERDPPFLYGGLCHCCAEEERGRGRGTHNTWRSLNLRR